MLRFVRVAVPVPLPRLFDYRLPDGLHAEPGHRVLVGFAKRRVIGVVVEVASTSELAPEQVQDVLGVPDPQPLIHGELMATLRRAPR